MDDRFDYILYFASRASPEEYQLNPIETLLSNSIGSYRMLELVKDLNATILFASTSEVYDDAKVIPIPETYSGNVNPIGSEVATMERGLVRPSSPPIIGSMGWILGLGVFNTFGPKLGGDSIYARVV